MTEVSSELVTLSIGAAMCDAVRHIPAVDARVLLGHVTSRTAAQLIAHDDAPLTTAQQAQFVNLVSQREIGEPVAYLTGSREFFSRSFRVTPDVLIPRPETELLVETALARLGSRPQARVLDLGTGSGCIGLTIVSEHSHLKLVAIDQSLAALKVTVENAQLLNVKDVRFVQSDWFDALDRERFDLIVSNPPYVADLDPHLVQGDVRFEPRSALAGGADGLDCIRIIVRGAAEHLTLGGWLLLEHGYDQAAAVREMMKAGDYGDVFSARDLAGIERVSGGRLTMPRPPR